MPLEPQDHQEKSFKPAEQAKPGEINPSDFLLPQKEVRKVESNQRVSAGVLLDQEVKAGQEGLPKTAAEKQLRRSEVGVPTEASGKESGVRPLETYQTDIERVIQSGDVSVVSIAAAEAQRRAQKGAAEKAPEAPAVPLRERVISFLKKF
ncbi:MAG: hypothetical protein Q7R71_01030, partial [bacterium]|nr:hypothetical protein [bacterium]